MLTRRGLNWVLCCDHSSGWPLPMEGSANLPRVYVCKRFAFRPPVDGQPVGWKDKTAGQHHKRS